MNPIPLDVLAIMAHPDDAELLCGGTLCAAAGRGQATGVLDLTLGESGSRGSQAERAGEAREAAEILGLSVRHNAQLPDGALCNNTPARRAVAQFIRQLRPEIVITHAPGGRHPDHRAASRLVYDAAFIAGLRNAPLDGTAHRPRKIIYALAYRQSPRRPSFVVDITDHMDTKIEAISAFRSQFDGTCSAGEVFAAGDRPLCQQVRAWDAAYGSLIRCRFGEPFWTRETHCVRDLLTLDVSTF